MSEAIQINCKGICPGCGDIVWPEQSATYVGAKVYHEECRARMFRVGGKVKVLLLGESEGTVGEVVGIRKYSPPCYWVRFPGPHSDIGCVWDYYVDEIEPVQGMFPGQPVPAGRGEVRK